MVRKDFDNLMKLHEGAVVFTGVTLASLELDFEIPRGFIIKIWKAILKLESVTQDIEGVSADKLIQFRVALYRDPDDINGIGSITNETQHDLIMDLEAELFIVAGTAGDPGYIFKYKPEVLVVPEHVDLISARNLRLNVRATGTDGADATETVAISHIWYTLEEVKDADILQLLDIL